MRTEVEAVEIATQNRISLSTADMSLIVDLVNSTDHWGPVDEVADLFERGVLSPEALTFFLPSMWENRPGQSTVPNETWRAMFEHALYTEQRKVKPRPRWGVVRAYRGAIEANREGLSWSLVLRQAEVFASDKQDPFGPRASVWVANIPVSRFYARYFDVLYAKGLEQEVVADVRGLDVYPIEDVDQLPWVPWWHRRWPWAGRRS